MPFNVTLQIPGGLSPLDRGDRYEDPIDEAFRKAGRVGYCTGGGTLLGDAADGLTPTRSDVELTIRDLPKALRALEAVLKQQKVPAGTVVKLNDPELDLLTVTRRGIGVIAAKDLPAKPPKPVSQAFGWKTGQLVRVPLDDRHFGLLHVVNVAVKPPFVRALDWVGTALPSRAELEKLCRTRARFDANEALKQVYRLRKHVDLLATWQVTDVTIPLSALTFGISTAVEYADTLVDEFRILYGLRPTTREERLDFQFGWLDEDQHIAVWDSGERRTLAQIDALCLAYCRKLPGRPSLALTPALEAFTAALKAAYPGRPRSVGSPFRGSFSAREKLMMIPVWEDRVKDLWKVASALAKSHGLNAYHINSGKLLRGK